MIMYNSYYYPDFWDNEKRWDNLNYVAQGHTANKA